MPYRVRFLLFLLAANIIVFVGAQLLSDLGAVVNILFAVVAAYFAVVIGRRVMKRDQL